MQGDKIDSCREFVRGERELTLLRDKGGEFMACRIVQGNPAFGRVGDKRRETDSDCLAGRVRGEGEERLGNGMDGNGLGMVEVGGEGGVLGDDYRARVEPDAVVPRVEKIVASRDCGERDGIIFEIEASSCDKTTGVVVGIGFHPIGLEIAECGCEQGVAGDDEGTRVAGVAVIPVHEGVSRSRDGGDGDGVALKVVAGASDGTPEGVARQNVGMAGIGGTEKGGEKGVLGKDDIAGIADVAIVPMGEKVSRVRTGADVTDDIVGETAGACDSAHLDTVVVRTSLEIVIVDNGECPSIIHRRSHLIPVERAVGIEPTSDFLHPYRINIVITHRANDALITYGSSPFWVVTQIVAGKDDVERGVDNDRFGEEDFIDGYIAMAMGGRGEI